MKKFRKYTFYIGLVGAMLSVISLVLTFFGVIDVMPIITEVVAIISAVLVSIGVVEKDEQKPFDELKKEIKNDLDKNSDDKK